VEADEDTNLEVGEDAASRQEVSSAAKPSRKTRAATAKQSVSTAAANVEAANTTKLEAEKKKRKRKTSPPLAVETLVFRTPPSQQVESDEEEDEVTDDPPVVEDRTVRGSLSPAAKRQRELEQKTTEDYLHQGLEVQQAAAGVQARVPVLIKVRTFRLKLRAPAAVRYGCRI
jgi:hypothetical protein